MAVSTNTTNLTLDYLIKLLKKGDSEIGYWGYTILVLGNYGSGKTTFTRWFTGHDDYLAFIQNSTLGGYIVNLTAPDDNSHTISESDMIPQRWIDRTTSNAFYDFPGFISPRGIIQDIATSHFIEKVVSNTSNVKFIFVLDHASLTNDKSWQDLKNLIIIAMKVVKNFEKFKDSFILLVSKVNKDKNTFSYEQIVNSLVISMKKAKVDLQRNMNENVDDNLKTIQFMDAVLRQKGKVYPYIQLFRYPDEEGPLRGIPLMQDNKRNITEALGNIRFSPPVDEADVDHFVPAHSLADVGILLREVHQRLLAAIRRFGQQVQNYLYNVENGIYDFVQLYLTTTSTHDTLIQVKSAANQMKTPYECVMKIFDVVNSLGDPSMYENSTYAQKYANYSSFLYDVSNFTVDESFKCADGLDNVIEYADKSRKWYKFLLDLYDNRLSTYGVQKNLEENSCNELAKFVIDGGEKNINKSSHELVLLARICDPYHEYEFKPTIMDEPKFNALYNLINLTMNHRVEYSCNDDRLLIKGQYVKLSTIAEYEEKCPKRPKSIQIFAVHKLFFDQDLEKIGEIELSILAETWDVSGIKKITIRGEEGEPHNVSKAADGEENGQEGRIGGPGSPGGPAGSFFGLGDSFVSIRNLVTSSIGGRGGGGQHGGDGARGKDGDDAKNDLDIHDRWPKISPNHYVLTQDSITGTCDNSMPCIVEEIYVLRGQQGGKGGNGGDGGVGGWGGFPANVSFNSTLYSGAIRFKNKMARGINGSGGDGGKGGKGGRYGRNGRVHVWNPTITTTNSTSKMNFTILNDPTEESASGWNGSSNINEDGIEHPRESKSVIDHNKILNEYKTYLRENMYHSIRESQMKEFYYGLPSEDDGKVSETPVTPGISSTPPDIYRRVSVRPNAPKAQLMEEPVMEPVQPTVPPTLLTNTPTRGAAQNLNSPINTAINSITNFLLPLELIYPAVITNYKLLRNGIKSMFEEFASSQSNTYSKSTTMQMDKFNVSGAIALADFLIRYVTKVKPYDSTEKPTDVSKVTAVTLCIITEFETTLKRQTIGFNLVDQPLEFDPISLISKLQVYLINRDYRNLTEILFQSVDNNVDMDYANFKKEMQPKIDRIQGIQSEEHLWNYCCGVDEIQSRNVNFHHVIHHLQLKKNYSLRLK